MDKNDLVHVRRLVLPIGCVLALLCGGPAFAGATWIDDAWNMVAFENASYPAPDFAPYLQKLDRIKTGLDRGDQQVAEMETDRLLKMLMDRRHGTNDVAADQIYNFALSVRSNGSNETTPLSSSIRIGKQQRTSHQRPGLHCGHAQ